MTNAHSATPCCDFLSRLQPRWAVLNGGGGAGEPATAGTTPGRRAQLPHGHATSGISREVQTERGLVAYRRYLELKSGGDGGATSDEAVAILRQLAREPYLADVVEEARAELEEKTTSQRVAAAMDPSDTLVDSCENAVDLQSRPSRFLAYVTHRNYAEWLERSNARLLDDDPLEHYMKAVSLDPSDAFLWWRIGSLYAQRGRLRDAALAFESGQHGTSSHVCSDVGKAPRPPVHPHQIKCLRGLVEVRLLMGDFDRCAASAQQLLAVDEEAQRARELLRMLESGDCTPSLLRERQQLRLQLRLDDIATGDDAMDEVVVEDSATAVTTLELDDPVSLLALGRKIIDHWTVAEGASRVIIDIKVATPVVGTDSAPEPLDGIVDVEENIATQPLPDDTAADDDDDLEETAVRVNVRSSTRIRDLQPTISLVSSAGDSSASQALLADVDSAVDLSEELDQMLPSGFSLDDLHLDRHEAVVALVQAQETEEGVADEETADSSKDLIHAFGLLFRRCLHTLAENADLLKKPARRGRRAKRAEEDKSRGDGVMCAEWAALVKLTEVASRGPCDAAVAQNVIELARRSRECRLTSLDMIICYLKIAVTVNENDVDTPGISVQIAELLFHVMIRDRCFNGGIVDLVDLVLMDNSLTATPFDKASFALRVARHIFTTITLFRDHLSTSSSATTDESAIDLLLSQYRQLLDQCFAASDLFMLDVDDVHERRRLQILACRLSSRVAFSLERNISRATTLLERCRDLLEMSTDGASDVAPSTAITDLDDINRELGMLHVWHTLDCAAEADPEKQSLEGEEIVRMLLPVVQPALAQTVYSQEFKNRDFWSRFRLLAALNTSLRKAGDRGADLWRSLVFTLNDLLTSIYDVDGLIEHMVDDWNESADDSSQYRFEIAMDVVRRVICVGKTLGDILDVIAVDPLSCLTDLDHDTRMTFLRNIFLCMHWANTMLVYSRPTLQVAARFRPNVAIDLDATLATIHKRFDSAEALARAVASLLRLTVRPFALFYYLRRGRFGMAGQRMNAGEFTTLDYLAFVHDQLAEARLCGEDDARLLRLIINHVNSNAAEDGEEWEGSDEESVSDGRPDSRMSREGLRQSELHQCYHCLYGVKLVRESSVDLVDHESITKCIPLPFDLDAAESIFEHIRPLIEDRLQRDQLLSRDYQEVVRRLGDLFEPSQLELTVSHPVVAFNCTNVDCLLDRGFHVVEDLSNGRGDAKVPLDVQDAVFSGGKGAVPEVFREFYFLKGRMHLVHSLKTTTNNEPVKKQSRIAGFESAMAAFRVDLQLNPNRLDSWHGLALAAHGIVEEMLSWSASYIVSNVATIGAMQRRVFWCLRRCVDLRRAALDEGTCAASATSPAERLAVLQQSALHRMRLIACHSEIGHLVYSMISKPMSGMATAESIKEHQVLDDIFAKSTESDNERSIAALKMPFTEMKMLAISKNITLINDENKPIIKRRRVNRNTSVDDSCSDDDTAKPGENIRQTLKSFTVDTRSVTRFPVSPTAHAAGITDDHRKVFYGYAATRFIQCRKQLRLLNATLEQMAAMQLQNPEAWRECLDGTSHGRLSPAFADTMPSKVEESWDWHWMLGRCSAKLSRDRRMVLQHYRRAIALSLPVLVAGNDAVTDAASRDGLPMTFNELNSCSRMFGLPRGVYALPATFLSPYLMTNVSSIGLKDGYPLMDAAYRWASYLTKEWLAGTIDDDELKSELAYIDRPSADSTDATDERTPATALLETYQRLHRMHIYYHRIVYRHAWLMFQLALRQDANSSDRAALVHAVRDRILSLFQLKTKFTNFWITDQELPGRFYLYTSMYAHLLVDACVEAGDGEPLELLGKKVRKQAVAHDVFWPVALRKRVAEAIAIVEKMGDGGAGVPTEDSEHQGAVDGGNALVDLEVSSLHMENTRDGETFEQDQSARVLQSEDIVMTE